MIESSLDKGPISLSDDDLARPTLTEKEFKQPKISKTPYTSEIEAAIAFYDDVVDSEVAKQGTKDYASGVAKHLVLP